MNALDKIDIGRAQLPKNYENARKALEGTHAIDECKDWADKAAALASYARQASDDTLLKISQRIQGRAVRRAGQLLREIEPSKGGDSSLFDARDGADPSVTRKSAADAAGLSERQRKTAIRVAGIPEDEFEEQIESDNPPTVTDLANRSKKKKNSAKDKIRELFGDAPFEDPKAFAAGIQIKGRISDLANQIKKIPSIEDIIHTMDDSSKDELRKNSCYLGEFFASLLKKLGD